MPDIKTAMSKVLDSWEKDAQQTQAQATPSRHTVRQVTPEGRVVWAATTNVTRETFEYVKAHPHVYGKDVIAALVAKGFRQNSVTSLLTQFVRQGLLGRAEDGRYYPIATEYETLKPYKKAPPPTQRKSKIVTSPRSAEEKAKAGIAALKVEPKKIKEAKPEVASTGVSPSAWDAETVINNIGLKQAHKLFLELNTYFGGHA